MATQQNIRASTQEHLEIEEIFDDLVILANSGAAIVIQTTAVNFGLLSEPEQDAIIYSYAGLLNSLSFPFQIVIRSKRMDISSYLESLVKWEQKQVNEKIRIQIKKYREFIASTIRENNVLDKRFYVVLPMFPEEIGLGATSPISFAPQKKGLKYSKEYIIDRAKNILLPKRDHILRQLTRIGLKATQLNTQQLIELFYDIYNPSVTGAQRLATRAEEYLSPIVSSAAEVSPAAPQRKNNSGGALAEEMSPAALFGDAYGKTPVQQQAKQAESYTFITEQQNPPLPQTQWGQSIQNAQTPWPTPPSPQQQQPGVTQGMQMPGQPTNQPDQQKQSTPSQAEADQVILNLQKAIEEARKKSSQPAK